MHKLINECMKGWMNVCMHALINEWINWSNGWMNEWMTIDWSLLNNSHIHTVFLKCTNACSFEFEFQSHETFSRNPRDKHMSTSTPLIISNQARISSGKAADLYEPESSRVLQIRHRCRTSVTWSQRHTIVSFSQRITCCPRRGSGCHRRALLGARGVKRWSVKRVSDQHTGFYNSRCSGEAWRNHSAVLW